MRSARSQARFRTQPCLTLRVLQRGPVADRVVEQVSRLLDQPGVPAPHASNELQFRLCPSADVDDVYAEVDRILDRPDNPDQRVVQRRREDPR